MRWSGEGGLIPLQNDVLSITVGGGDEVMVVVHVM